jgi:excisionase family DNA binding protein
MIETPLVLDVAGVARLIGVSRRTVEHEIARGELQSLRIGRVRRVRRVDVEAYLAKRVEAEAESTDVDRLGPEAQRLVGSRRSRT